MFNHVNMEALPELDCETLPTGRTYITPEGNKYPSITTVLSLLSKDGILAWRKRVGEEAANKISTQAATRGTAVHQLAEDYLNNKEDWSKGAMPANLFSFNQIKPILDKRVNNVWAQEVPLYSDKFMVAGRVDCIAEFDGELTIIDFKTSTRERSDSWNENYYIQGSAYAEMFGERTGIEINQVVILVVTEDGTVQEFVKDKEKYLPMLEESVTEWSRQNETPINIDGDVSSSGLSNNAIG